MNRRKLIGGIGLLVAAPAIVKISNIMPVKAWDVNPCAEFGAEYVVDLRLTNGIHPAYKTHHYMRVNRHGVAVLDPSWNLELKAGDRVELVVHDDRCRPLLKTMVVGQDYMPIVVKRTIAGWEVL